MIYRRLVGIAWPDRDARVLAAAAWLHERRLEVTARSIDARVRLGRRTVEKSLVHLAEADLVKIHDGRPRSIEPLVRFVAWDEPNLGPMARSATGIVTVNRLRNRRAGTCPHPLICRLGRLCFRCGEVVDATAPTDVSSTSV